MPTEVELGEHKYRTGRLDAFKQFHLFRKLMPVLSGMGATFTEGGFDNDNNAVFWGALGPASQAIADMSVQDSEYILKTCLQVCSMWNGSAWVRITNANGDLMFDNIDMMEMMQLCFEVMKDNLSSFFAAPLPNGSAAEEVGPQLHMLE